MSNLELIMELKCSSSKVVFIILAIMLGIVIFLDSTIILRAGESTVPSYPHEYVTKASPEGEGKGSVDKHTDIMKVLQMDSAKRSVVLYMVQGPARAHSIWNIRLSKLGPTAVLIYHSYDRECKACIYNNKTNPATGRNFLLRHALKNVTLVQTVKYFTFLDWDIQMKCTLPGITDCWKAWHSMLLDSSSNWAEVNAKTWKDPPNEMTNMQVCVDVAMVTVHHEALHTAMPQSEHLYTSGAWYNAHVHWHVSNRCIPFAKLSDSHWELVNPAHSSYVGYKNGFNASVVYEILEHELPSLGPWRDEKVLRNHCLVSYNITSSWNMKDICVGPLRQRFMNWYKSDVLW